MTPMQITANANTNTNTNRCTHQQSCNQHQVKQIHCMHQQHSTPHRFSRRHQATQPALLRITERPTDAQSFAILDFAWLELLACWPATAFIADKRSSCATR